MNNDLYIDLSKITKSDGTHIEVTKEFPKESFLELDSEINLTSPVTLVGSITNYNNTLAIDSVLNFSIAHACDRCLNSYIENYEIPFCDTIAKENALLAADEYIPYAGNKVLLTDAIYKCIFAETFHKHICKPDCKGLCGSCGCDLNGKTCDCKTEEIDPRLLKLKDLLN